QGGGRVFVAEKRVGIVAIDPRSGDVTRIVDMHRTERLRGTNDLVFDDAGGLYFTEPYGSGVPEPNGRVLYLPADGSGLRVLEDSMAFPNVIVLSPDVSAVHGGEYGRKRSISVPSLAPSAPSAPTSALSRPDGCIGPDGIAFDERGNLYA